MSRWSTVIASWARLGVWEVIQVRGLPLDEPGTCELCGKHPLKYHWDVRVIGGHDVYSIGSDCGPTLVLMSADWNSRAAALAIWHSRDERAAAAKYEFNMATLNLRRRIDVATKLRKGLGLADETELLKTLLSGAMKDFELKQLASRVRLLERVLAASGYPDREPALLALRTEKHPHLRRLGHQLRKWEDGNRDGS